MRRHQDRSDGTDKALRLLAPTRVQGGLDTHVSFLVRNGNPQQPSLLHNATAILSMKKRLAWIFFIVVLCLFLLWGTYRAIRHQEARPFTPPASSRTAQ